MGLALGPAFGRAELAVWGGWLVGAPASATPLWARGSFPGWRSIRRPPHALWASVSSFVVASSPLSVRLSQSCVSVCVAVYVCAPWWGY